MIILTLNCGSSSAKFQIYDWEDKEVLGTGMVERIGIDHSRIEMSAKGKPEFEATRECPDHVVAVQWIIDTILNPQYGCLRSLDEIKVCGHRIVHGGPTLKQSTLITESLIQTLESIYSLDPLHNKAHVDGIRAVQKVLPSIPQVAVFDTAWHQTMPEKAYLYAVPQEWHTRYHVRKYGFHGTSFLYTAKRAAVLLNRPPQETNLIICHIGNGSSMSCVQNGIEIDTTMGLTCLDGLIMGTRCGDIDPAVVNYLCNQTGKTVQEIDMALNKECGILGITGKFSDRRDIQAGVDKGDPVCILAQQMEGYRIKKYIGAFTAALNGKVDAVVFTAGVGEMNPAVRQIALEGLSSIGMKTDPQKNALSHYKCAETCISADDSPTKIFVIPTDEELVMTEDCYALLNGTYTDHTQFHYCFQDKNYVNKERAAKLKKVLALHPEVKTILA